MPDQPLSVFISYSRTDSAFVDRLEADLQARSFHTWVDRRKLEGGQDWMDILQGAIEKCHVLLVIVSPKAIESKYVRMEYRFANSKGKLVIPLEYQPCKDVPIDLNGIQWIKFKNIYDQGLKDLLIALSPIKLKAVTAPKLASTQEQTHSHLATVEKEPILVVPQPAPPPPNPDLILLYREGVAAKAEGNLERNAILWQQALDRDPNFGNRVLVLEMEKLMQDLHPIRVRRLRERAEEAHNAGEWGQEIGSWRALLGLEPKDPQAIERIPIAEQNQKYAWMYEAAEQDIQENKLPAARIQLEMLWRYAPHYGDPARFAVTVKMEAPLNYSAMKATEAQEWQSQAIPVIDISQLQEPERYKPEVERRMQGVSFASFTADFTWLIIVLFTAGGGVAGVLVAATIIGGPLALIICGVFGILFGFILGCLLFIQFFGDG